MPESGFEDSPEEEWEPSQPVRPREVPGESAGRIKPLRRGARLVRKEEQGILPFTRIVTRPQTAIDSTVAVDGARTEAGIPTDGPRDPSFGKMRPVTESLEYRPNRIHDVVTDTFEHSRLNWLTDGRPRRILAWVVAGVFGVALAVLVAIFGREAVKDLTTALRGSPQVVRSLPPMPERIARVRAAVDGFLQAREWPDRLPFVLDPRRVESKMRDYYDVRRESGPVVTGYDLAGPTEAAGRWWFLVTFQDKQAGDIAVIMQETADGGRLDWENFVSFGTMPWAGFCAEKPETPHSLRVRIRPATNAGNTPGSDYDAFEVSHRSGEPVLMAFAAAGSREAQTLTALVEPGSWKPVNLYIRFERRGDDTEKVPVISGVVRNHWLDEVELKAVTDSATREDALSASGDP